MEQRTPLILRTKAWKGHIIAMAVLSFWLVLSSDALGVEDDVSSSSLRWSAERTSFTAEGTRPVRVAGEDRAVIAAGEIDESPAEVYIRATPMPRSELEYVMPGEFERQSALLLSAGSLATSAPDVLIAMAEAASGRIPLLLLVNDDREFQTVSKLMSNHGVGPHVSFLRVPHNTMWVRDYGPVVLGPSFSPLVVDAAYSDHERTSDDAVPSVIAGLSESPAKQISLSIPGGNLLANGRGICITTTRVQEENPGLTQDSIAAEIAESFGATTVVLLQPLDGESTGHVDMFATFTDAETVVVGKYDPAIDAENARILDENAAMLASVDAGGQNLRVVRIPMPGRKEASWPTFTNVVYANGRLLVPVYENTTQHQLRTIYNVYASLLPSWEVHFIRADSLICHGGSLHCVVSNLGKLPTPDHGDSRPLAPQPLPHRSRLASTSW